MTTSRSGHEAAVMTPVEGWAALDAVVRERARQDAKWGEQNHPIVEEQHVAAPMVAICAARRHSVPFAVAAKALCDEFARQGRVTYADILVEEVAELVKAAAIHGDASDAARAEAVQVAAVALAIVERIDRARAAKGGV